MKLLTLENKCDDVRLAFCVLQNIDYEPVSHERHWISTFSKMAVYLPKEKIEQKRLGTFLSNIDNLITLHQRNIFFNIFHFLGEKRV